MLNRRRRWADRIDDPMVTVGAATDRFNEIKDRHTRDGLADYVAIAGDDRTKKRRKKTEKRHFPAQFPPF